MKKAGMVSLLLALILAVCLLGAYALRAGLRPAMEVRVLPCPTRSGEAERIDINTADAEQLAALPGIGPVLARRIVDYREANGPFAHLADLVLVEGIGSKKLEAVWDLITLGG